MTTDNLSSSVEDQSRLDWGGDSSNRGSIVSGLGSVDTGDAIVAGEFLGLLLCVHQGKL